MVTLFTLLVIIVTIFPLSLLPACYCDISEHAMIIVLKVDIDNTNWFQFYKQELWKKKIPDI